MFMMWVYNLPGWYVLLIGIYNTVVHMNKTDIGLNEAKMLVPWNTNMPEEQNFLYLLYSIRN